MLQPKSNSFVYYLDDPKKGKSKKESEFSKPELQKILETLSKQAMKENSPEYKELESILKNSIETDSQDPQNEPEKDSIDKEDSGSPITKFLTDKGYLQDKENWLTRKGFLEIGQRILYDVMKDLKNAEQGLHETNQTGAGNVMKDTTKKFEPGNDIKFLSPSTSLLNSILRLSKSSKKLEFPITLEPDDLEEYETLNDVRVAVVYCIDLSSTMKYAIGKKGKSRIEAAKKALWSLYLLNKKFFPNDTVTIVGFASMASIVNPFDIPALKTYDANQNFLHYTNYQAALRLARKILSKDSAENKRIVLITDGQPSACFVDNEYQKNEIISEKPYSNFYAPEPQVLEKLKNERNLKLDVNQGSLVYLCYRFKKVDPKVHNRTLIEAKKCKKVGIEIDTIVVSEEKELLQYAQDLEKELKGKTFYINQENMDKVLVNDYLSKTRKVLRANSNW